MTGHPTFRAPFVTPFSVVVVQPDDISRGRYSVTSPASCESNSIDAMQRPPGKRDRQKASQSCFPPVVTPRGYFSWSSLLRKGSSLPPRSRVYSLLSARRCDHILLASLANPGANGADGSLRGPDRTYKRKEELRDAVADVHFDCESRPREEINVRFTFPPPYGTVSKVSWSGTRGLYRFKELST